LEGIIRDSALAVGQKLRWNWIIESRRDLLKNPNLLGLILHRRSRVSVFSNHKVFLSHSTKVSLKKSKIVVFVTQLQDNELNMIRNNIQSFNLAKRIIVQNLFVFESLIEAGVSKNIVSLFPGAIDRNLFYPAPKTDVCKDKFVLVSGDFKERKNPEMIKKVISQLPDINFIIHGHNLEIFGIGFFDSFKNVELIPFNFLNQPKLMRDASAYLMISTLEGGPIPVLESLASGTPVVASNVGFCSEYINSENGWLLNNSSNVHEIENALTYAMDLKSKVSNHDLLKGRFTWIESGNLFFDL
jgi:glycosyltransferase involved in cell wall biosynthesis